MGFIGGKDNHRILALLRGLQIINEPGQGFIQVTDGGFLPVRILRLHFGRDRIGMMGTYREQSCKPRAIPLIQLLQISRHLIEE
ncbi:hypothetical protein D3C76_1731410 [compost metagenome]